MKYLTFLTTLSLRSSPLANNPLPIPLHRAPDPAIPEAWQFDFASFNGPGCPDFGAYNRDETDNLQTGTRMGPYMFNSSVDTFWWYLGYPWLRLDLDDAGNDTATGEGVEREVHRWCEVELKYDELSDYTGTRDKKYRLRMGKNGTLVEAQYGLEEGVRAEWSFSYWVEGGEEKVVDSLVVNGPIDNDVNTTRVDYAAVREERKRLRMPNCGSNTFRMRTDLKLISERPGAKGSVRSKQVVYSQKPYWYGPSQGFSYDWEYCNGTSSL